MGGNDQLEFEEECQDRLADVLDGQHMDIYKATSRVIKGIHEDVDFVLASRTTKAARALFLGWSAQSRNFAERQLVIMLEIWRTMAAKWHARKKLGAHAFLNFNSSP